MILLKHLVHKYIYIYHIYIYNMYTPFGEYIYIYIPFVALLKTPSRIFPLVFDLNLSSFQARNLKEHGHTLHAGLRRCV